MADIRKYVNKGVYLKNRRERPKYRLHFRSACLRDCENRDIKCNECIRFDQYVQKSNDNIQ